jgi:uncharacterized protein (TIGR03085 family)
MVNKPGAGSGIPGTAGRLPRGYDRHMTFSRDERTALCRLLDEVGPDAPTLCEGWTTYDLAAHLVARERRPDAGPGLLVRQFSAWTERVRLGEKRRAYPEVVDLVRGGPPAWSPMGLPVVEPVVNTVEYFVHHEDVRRAQDGWEPRELPRGLQEMLWRQLRARSRMFFRRVPVGVVLRRPDGVTAPARSGTPEVQLVGQPGELTLYAYGRRDHARVTVEGDEGAVKTLARAPVGL